MGLAIVLLVYPLALLIAIIIMKVAGVLSVGAMVIGVPLVALVVGAGYGVIKYSRGLDIKAGVGQAPK
tara:strand:+ start:19152 stop:19355 length:204 start_codon:yes stop_codon:yes gene_type:complete